MSRALVLSAVLTGVAVPRAYGADDAWGVHHVRVGKTTYWVGDMGRAAGWFAGKYRGARDLMSIAEQCGARAYGFYSPGAKSMGASGWVPTDLSTCDGNSVEGGGPSDSHPCHKKYPTPEQPDLRGLHGDTDVGHFWVALAGTSANMCPDLMAEAPGGIWGTLLESTLSIPVGRTVIAKCSRQTKYGPVYFAVTPSLKWPASVGAEWIWPAHINTGYSGDLPIPSC